MPKLFTLKTYLFINSIQYLDKTKSNYRNINKLELIFKTINYTKHWEVINRKRFQTSIAGRT